jgi:lipopolysaccharide export system permease protein
LRRFAPKAPDLIKKLDILIIRSFIGPFIVTFFVSLFVLVMQFFWLYMDELIGKGLGIWMILKLLFYMSATMVPMALPLGILLASIMTFGNMGENFELVAIKSAGISLLRFMRPLLFFIMMTGGLAFLFNNNIIPVANLKALSLLYDLRNSKPTLNIRAGQFNRDIENYAIRVGEKDKDGRTIRGILIYDHTSGYGNDNVVLANEGVMIPATGKQYLIFRLKDGWRYEEAIGSGGRRGHDQTRMHFKKWDKVFDLSSFKLSRTNEDLFKGAYQMMNIRQLNQGIDSINRYKSKLSGNVESYLSPYLRLITNSDEKKQLFADLKKMPASSRKYKSSLLQLIPPDQRQKTVQFATGHVRNSKGLLDITASDKRIQSENALKFNVEWHRKFTLSFACVLLFLIGAPLGAIIRKGGLGMPLVIAISFFILFHIMSITGEKLAKSGALVPWIGMWMATAMLLPIAFFLINAARKDSSIFTKELYGRWWKAIGSLWVRRKAIA